MFRALLFFLIVSSQCYASTSRDIIDTVAGAKALGYLGHNNALQGIPYSFIEFPTENLPEEYDSRLDIEMPPIRDQGACGSCWVHAPIRALEISYSAQNKTVLDLSEQEMLSCESSGYKCSGGFMESAAYLLQGITDEKSWPYRARNTRCKKTRKIAFASEIKLLGSKDTHPSVDEIKGAIHHFGSAFVTVAAGNGWTGKTGEIPQEACRVRGTNHMVTLVGWTKDDKWIMANSWGAKWGNKGYSLIKFGCAQIGDEAGYVQSKVLD